MESKYPFFKYVPQESKIHTLNSKMKILWFLIMLLSILITIDYVSALLILLFLLFVMSMTKIELEAYVTSILTVWPIYALAFIISFFFSLDVVFSLLMILKLALLILLFTILTFTTSLSEIAWGFECLFSFLKKIRFPVSSVALKIAMIIKFISTLLEEFKNVRKSMAYRGIPYKSGFLKTFKMMFAPSVRLAYKHSLRMASVMKLRFYGNSKRRTNYHENKVTSLDKKLIVPSVVLVYLAVWLGWLR